MVTIGGKNIITRGIGTAIWSCTDDEGKLHTKTFNNVLYLPESLVNILSATALAESIKDGEVIWVITKRKYSSFT